MPRDPEHGKHWFFWTAAAAIIALTVVFPPQRRAAYWTDSAWQPAPWWHTSRFDRFEFGYIPSYRPLWHLNGRTSSNATATVTLLGVGPYRYSESRWVVDWLWVLVAMIPAVVLIVIGWSYCPPDEKAWFRR